MMDPGIIAACVFGTAALAAFILAYHFENKRKEAIKASARIIGFRYSDWDVADFTADLQSIPLRQQGRSNTISLSLVGRYQGRETALFELSYVTGSGKRRTTHRYLCCAVKVGRNFPKFKLRPEGWLDAIGEKLGFDDIDISSDPEFSKQFHLSGREAASLIQAFTPTIRRKLLELGKVEIEASGEMVVYYRKSQKIDPKNLSAILESYSQVLRIFF
jgi:hypothetical protein